MRQAKAWALALAGLWLVSSRRGSAKTPTVSTTGRLTLAQLEQLARDVGWPAEHANRAARIAMRESAGNPNAHKVVTRPARGFLPEDSRGLWQINVLAWPQYAARDLYDPRTNAEAALAIWRAAGWRPWKLSSEATK